MRRKLIPGVAAGVLIAALVAPAARRPAAAADLPPQTRPAPRTPADLFDGTAVWTVHLSFTPEQWAAMEPKGGQSGFGLMFGPPGGRPRPPGRSAVLAPVFVRDGDANDDGKLSKDEFRGLAEKWFAAWDGAKAGTVDAAQLRAGLDATFAAAAGRVNRGIGLSLRGEAGKRNGLASVMGVEFEYVRADLNFHGRTLEDVAVRYKGNGTFMDSRGSLKRSLKVDLNRHADGQRVAGVTGLNLHNNVTDAGWMNEVLSHRLYRDAGVPAPRTAYARVYVSIPGKHDRAYLGLYSLVEDVGKAFVKDRFGSAKGALFKPVTPDLFTELGGDWSSYRQTYDPKNELTDAQQRRVIEFARLVTRAGDDEFAEKLGGYLDLEQFARYMAVTTYLSTLDSILSVGQNYYLYLHPKTNKFQFIPWDLDHSFGYFPFMGTQAQREQLSIRKPWRGDNRFLDRVFKVEAFRALYLARTAEFTESVFKPERLHRQVDEVAAAIRDAVREESPEKLERFDKAAAGEPVPSRRAMLFTRFPPVTPIKPFVTARWKSVSEQVAGRSDGQTIGAEGIGFGRGGAGGPAGGPAPGASLAPVFLTALDADKDGSLGRDEVVGGFGKWFDDWDADKRGVLTDEQLRGGIDRSLGARPRSGAR